MIEPGIPENETERVRALREFAILDTKSESIYDDIVAVASYIFETPIALISLLDEDRQWFKAKKGVAAQETSRSISFCGHAILDDEVTVVSDATEDQRFFDNPLVTEDPHIRFYAGAPLVTIGGYKVGTLCVIDEKPRQPKPEQLKCLSALSRQVSHLMESRRVAKQLAQALEDVKTLSGLVPICSYCKSVRNDEGFWKSIEAFVASHSDAKFSHGICPVCMQKHFPHISKKVE